MGGWFAAERSNLQRFPLALFQTLHAQQQAPNAEVDHFIERLWGMLLTADATREEISAAWSDRRALFTHTYNQQFLSRCCGVGKHYTQERSQYEKIRRAPPSRQVRDDSRPGLHYGLRDICTPRASARASVPVPTRL